MASEQKRIFVVEDEAITALDISDSLEKAGFELLGVADTGEEAVERCSELSPDLVLMDIQLKGKMDGIEAAVNLWQSHQLPVVFLTAFADETTLARAKLARPYGYVMKPFEDQELRAAVEIALHRHELSEPTAVSASETSQISKELDFGTTTLSPLEFLRRVDPFRALPEEEQTLLAESAAFHEHEEGSEVLFFGQSELAPFVVAAGRISLKKSSSGGKDLTVGLLGPGDIFGVVLANHEESSPYQVLAETESKTLQLSKSTLLMVQQRHPELYKVFSEYLSDRLRIADTFAHQLAHEKVESRIAFALTVLLESFSRVIAEEEDDAYEIGITRQQLAELTGTTPETAIRVTKSMERSGLLDLSQPGRVKVVDDEGLHALIAA